MLPLVVISAALAGDLQFGSPATLEPGQKPWFTLAAPKAVLELQVSVEESGGETYKFTRTHLAANQTARFEWARNADVTTAVVSVLVEYEDHYEEELSIPLSWSYGALLQVDLSHASADVGERTLTVGVTARVDSAEIVAYGAHKMVLDQRTTEVNAGPGPISVPWVGDPGEVVLLDVTLHAGNAWSGFTYSPWFLDIPHDDVLFETDKSAIRPEEEPKLEATMAQLRDVLDKYGEIVPVKLYIGGCTDTVGEASHNLGLSQARAKAIALWLRAHGYDKPIFFHGFGEGWLAVKTADDVDSPSNRRAAYMVGANPPPAGSGVPSVNWTPL